ncbi:hypothetical protein LMG24235_06604 [Paraburkholderia sabiae]|nr:hypothetical protein LMG24235_06604 [Paraburkholderia sabiae]
MIESRVLFDHGSRSRQGASGAVFRALSVSTRWSSSRDSSRMRASALETRSSNRSIWATASAYWSASILSAQNGVSDAPQSRQVTMPPCVSSLMWWCEHSPGRCLRSSVVTRAREKGITEPVLSPIRCCHSRMQRDAVCRDAPPKQLRQHQARTGFARWIRRAGSDIQWSRDTDETRSCRSGCTGRFP